MGSYVNRIKIGDTTHLIEPTLYGTCSTAAATTAKTVSLEGFELQSGVTVAVKFTVTNTAANPTLSINSSDAKAIYYHGSAIAKELLAANKIYYFVYDGSHWEIIGDLDTDTDTKVTQTAVGNTYTYWRPLLFGASNSSSEGFSPSTVTSSVYATAALSVQPSTGTIKANIFKGSGESLTSLNASNISSGTLSADRLATSGATAGSYGPSAAVSGTDGTTMNVPYITVDNKGRVTGIENKVYTSVNTWRPIGTGATDAAAGNHSHTLKIGYKSLSVNTSEQTWNIHDIFYNSNSIGTDTSWDKTEPGAYYVASSAAFTGDGHPGTNQNAPYTYGGLYVLRANNGGAAQIYISHSASDSAHSSRGIRYRSGWNVINNTAATHWVSWATILDDKNYSLYTWKRPSSITTNQVLISNGTDGTTTTRAILNNTTATVVTGSDSLITANTLVNAGYVKSSGVTSITIKTSSPLTGGSDTATTSTGTYTLGIDTNGTWSGNATTATTATNLANNPSIQTSGTTQITITAGGKTSSAYTVPYATSAGSATSATTATYIKCSDTRSTALNPTDLNAAQGVRFDFKAKGTINLTATDAYAGVMSFRPYASNSDWSGGNAHQLAFNSQGLHWRTGGASWGDWYQILDSNNTTAPSSVPTLSWNTESTVFTLNGSAVKIKAMAKPTYTYSDVGAAANNHTHGNITNDGKLSGSTVSGAVTTAHKFLREDGTWVVPAYLTIGTTSSTAMAGNTVVTNVTQTGNIEDKEFSILLKNTNNTTDETAGTKFGKTTDKLVTVNPSTGTLSAASYKGSWEGNTIGASYGGTGKTTLQDSANALINALGTGDSNTAANDYIITQYVNGGTTHTTYYRRPASKVVNATLVKAALGTNSTHGDTFLRKDGTWQTPPYPVTSVNNKTGAVTISAEDLGLSSAMHFRGKATVAITENSTTDPTISGYTFGTNGASALAGDVILDKDSEYEYVWTADGTSGKWEKLGSSSSYKVTQTAITNSTGTADGSNTSTTFVYSFSQDTNGVVSTKTRALPTASTSTAGITKVGASGGAAAFDHTHSYAGSSSAGGAATTANTTADTTNALYLVGVTSAATTTLKRDTSITMTGGTITATTFSGNLSGNATTATSANYINLYEARGTTTTLNKTANYVAAGAMFHLVASSSTSSTDNGKTPTDANILQMNWDNNGGFDAQLGISTSGSRMYYRSQPSGKTVWQEVAHVPVRTTNLGSTTQPVYMTSEGVLTVCTTYADATVGNANKVAAKLAATTKHFLLGTSTTLTGTATNVELLGDGGIYATTTSGELSAVRYSLNTSGTEKAYITYNTTDDAFDFIFI